MQTIGCLLVVGLLTGVQSAPDSSLTLPPEFVVRSTTINGQQTSYRLVDVSIIVSRVFLSGAEVRLIIAGAGPFAHYGIHQSSAAYRCISTKIPNSELSELVDSLDLGRLATQESVIINIPPGEMTRTEPDRDPRRQELKLEVRIGEYQQSVTCASFRPEEKVELPVEILNFLNQLERSPTIRKMVSDLGVKLASNSLLQPAPSVGVD